MKLEEGARKLADIFIYPYGKFYDENNPKSISSSDAIIVYVKTKGETKAIESICGFFISISPFPEDFDGCNPLCRPDEKEMFERKYNGKFYEFSGQ
jgi:hypothetical protein